MPKTRHKLRQKRLHESLDDWWESVGRRSLSVLDTKHDSLASSRQPTRISRSFIDFFVLGIKSAADARICLKRSRFARDAFSLQSMSKRAAANGGLNPAGAPYHRSTISHMESLSRRTSKGYVRDVWNPNVLAVYKQMLAEQVDKVTDGLIEVIYASNIGDAKSQLARQASHKARLIVMVRIYTRAWQIQLLLPCAQCKEWFSIKRVGTKYCPTCGRRRQPAAAQRTNLTRADAMIRLVSFLQKYPGSSKTLLASKIGKAPSTTAQYLNALKGVGLIIENGHGLEATVTVPVTLRGNGSADESHEVSALQQ